MKICTDAVLFGAMAPVNQGDRVLDIGTGTGVLALMATQLGAAKVTAVELTQEAYQEADINFKNSPWAKRLEVVHQDIQSFALTADLQYDLIISNPPYVDAAAVAALPPEYLHEPQLALGSGKDGLDATREILKHAAQHLVPDGILAVEIGHNRAALEAAFPDLPFTWLDVSAGDEFVFMLHKNDLP